MKAAKKIAVLLFALFAFGATMVVAQAPAAAPGPQTPPQALPQPQPQPQPAPPPASLQPGPEAYRGTVLNQGGSGTRYWLGDWFDLQIDQYNSDEETLALALALREGGQKAVLDKLQTMTPVGMLSVGGRGDKFPLFLARSKQSPAGRVIRCLTTRPIASSELNFGAKAMEYPFGIIEILLPQEGPGTGQIVGMGQIGFSEATTIQVKAFGLVPMRLRDVVLRPEPIKK